MINDLKFKSARPLFEKQGVVLAAKKGGFFSPIVDILNPIEYNYWQDGKV